MMLFFSPAVNILLSVKRVQKLTKLNIGESNNGEKGGGGGGGGGR